MRIHITQVTRGLVLNELWILPWYKMMHCCYNLSRRRTDYSCKAHSPVCWPGRNENGKKILILSPRSNLVACQVADVNGGWSTLPALKQARWDWFFISPYLSFASEVLFKSLYFRADHGCAVIKDSKGRTGILVVGGVGDKVEKTFFYWIFIAPFRAVWPLQLSSWTLIQMGQSGRQCPTLETRDAALQRWFWQGWQFTGVTR